MAIRSAARSEPSTTCAFQLSVPGSDYRKRHRTKTNRQRRRPARGEEYTARNKRATDHDRSAVVHRVLNDLQGPSAMLAANTQETRGTHVSELRPAPTATTYRRPQLQNNTSTNKTTPPPPKPMRTRISSQYLAGHSATTDDEQDRAHTQLLVGKNFFVAIGWKESENKDRNIEWCRD
jgi:hypothetical protein